MTHIPGAVDVHVQQAFDAPTLYMDLDRTRSQYVGMQARDVAQNLLVSLSSASRLRRVLADPRTVSCYTWRCKHRNTAMTRFRRCKILHHWSRRRRDAADSGEPGAHEDGGAPCVHLALQRATDINVYASVYQRDLGSVAQEVRRRCKRPKRICRAEATS